MPKNNSKTRAMSDAEIKEVHDTSCAKYLNKTVKINTLHALQKYLYWIVNYFNVEVYKKDKGSDISDPAVKILIDQLTNYARQFIKLGYTKYFSNFSIHAYHWAETIRKNIKKGDFSGMVMKIKCSDTNDDDYFELSVATQYLSEIHGEHPYHKVAQYVKHYSNNNALSDINRISDLMEKELSYLFLPYEIASAVEKNILDIIKESDDMKCWVILQTGYTF